MPDKRCFPGKDNLIQFHKRPVYHLLYPIT